MKYCCDITPPPRERNSEMPYFVTAHRPKFGIPFDKVNPHRGAIAIDYPSRCGECFISIICGLRIDVFDY